MALVPRQIYPAVKRGSGEGIEIRVFAGRCEHHGSVAFTHQSRQCFDRISRCQSVDEGDARALAISRHGIIHPEIAKERFGGDSKRRAAGDDSRIRRRVAQRVQHAPRFGSVVAERDCIAVVDVPNGHADDVGSEAARGLTSRRDGISGKAEIQETDPMPGCIQR